MGIRPLDRKRVNGYVRCLSAHVVDVTPVEIEAAAAWYPSAGVIAAEVARRLGTSLEVGACVVSAFSPRCTWAQNVVDALRFADGEHVAGFAQKRDAATASLTRGFDALNGPKTNAFARAIAGDPEAVVIDVWMARAAGLATDAPTIVQYREVAEAVRIVARRLGLAPATCQALIWGRVRGGLD